MLRLSTVLPQRWRTPCPPMCSGPKAMGTLTPLRGRQTGRQLLVQPLHASVTRILVSQPPSMYARMNRPLPTGPISLLVSLFCVIAGVLAIIRAMLVRKVKGCQSCRGFGIVRCRLCNGQGNFLWRAKQSYADMCPLCMSKRYTVCGHCGGFHHRAMFIHSQGGAYLTRGIETSAKGSWAFVSVD